MLINGSILVIPFFKASMASTVKVHNVSLQASERDIKEFFSFSGDIVHVEMQGLVPHIPMIIDAAVIFRLIT
jgi:hypothetical protein